MAGGEDLRRELGGDLPPAMDALPDAELALLAAALRDARVRQAQALAAATDSGLGFIPRPLRGPVKRVLFG